MLCGGLVIISFTHSLQGHITATGAIIGLFQNHELTLKNMGKSRNSSRIMMKTKQSTTNHVRILWGIRSYFQQAILHWWQGSWGQHGAHLGLTGPRWAPCWPHELCYLGRILRSNIANGLVLRAQDSNGVGTNIGPTLVQLSWRWANIGSTSIAVWKGLY